MKYFDIITKGIAIAMAGLGGLFTLFIVIRDKFFKKDNEGNGNQGSNGTGGYEDIW